MPNSSQKASRTATVKKKRRKRAWRRRIVLGLTIITLGGIGAGGYYAWNKYSPMAYSYVTNGYEIVAQINEQTLETDRTTIIRDAQGNVLKELNSISNLNTPIADVNALLKDGFVAVEDERFYAHHGVDGWATLRAVVNKLKGGSVQGGSTLTQQLVKNKILQNSEVSAERKVTEMVIAQELEKRFTKDQILESYLNSVYFGHGAYGVNAAAKAYFNKDQKDLTVREAAVVISLTNNPTLYDPSINPEESKTKVAEILVKMKRNGVINEEQYMAALKEETVLNFGELFNEREFTDNYALSFAISRAAEEMAKADGFEMVYKFATDEEYQAYQELRGQVMQQQIDKILGGGYEIQTTIDMGIQQQIEQSVYNQLAGWQDVNPETGKLDLQASVTVVDNTTHNVVAVVGGRGTEGDYVNRAWNGYRQPGSTSKPIIAYTPAFDAGTLTPNSTILDAQVPEYPTVVNATGSYSNSNMTLRRAVDMSLNTTAIRASLGTDMNVVTDNLAKMQFARLHPYDVNNIIAIGGFTYGVTTTEMAGAYSAFTNQGNYVKPTNVEQIRNTVTGEVVYQNPRTKVKIYSQEASYAMLDILKTAATGWTTYYQQAVADNYPKELQAGKSGTTDDYKDSYWMGVNAYYTTAVWVGRDSNTNLKNDESNQSKAISRNLANILLAGKDPRDFVKPDTVIKNGDSITFTAMEDLSQAAEQLTASAFTADQEAARADSKSKNQTRLNDNAYRIVYGLSQAEEETLEAAAQRALDEIDVSQFTKKSQYEDYLQQLSNARTDVSKVKRASKNAELTASLAEIQSAVSTQYAAILYQENVELYQSNQQQISAAEDKAESAKAALIAEQERALEAQKKVVESSPTKANVDKLDEIVYNLNRLGKQQAYFEVVVKNGKFVSMSELAE